MLPTISFSEILRSAHQALLRNWGRAVLTSLSMIVGTASIVLVIIIGVSSKALVLDIIQGVGINFISIYPEYADETIGTKTHADSLNLGDEKAILTEVPGVRYVAPVINSYPSIAIEGIARRVSLIGTTPSYQPVRNIKVVQNNFIDENDERFRNKVCVITEILAQKLARDPFFKGYINFYGVPFKVIGTFREGGETFGQTEVTDYSAIIPISVMRNFRDSDALNQIYVSAEDMRIVPRVTVEIRQLLLLRHHMKELFKVDNVAKILRAADQITTILTAVLWVVAAISLIASGINIMNVMLITVTERTKEIGIKKSIGAYRGVLLMEFLAEALILSSGGGLIGTFLGVAAPYSVRFFTTAVKIEIPAIAIILGFGVTLLVGLTFGILPALRAARMNPVEALRYE
jgi:putative ABC transport system permease protein